jgi:hypothetical protein
MTGVSASALVRRIASEHPDIADPKALVPFMMDELTGLEQEVLRRLLPSYISSVLRRAQTSQGDEQDEWTVFLGERVPTKDGTKFVRDATANDLDEGAKRRERFAGALDGRALKFSAAAREIRNAGVETAGDLPVDTAVDMLRSLKSKQLSLRKRRLGATARAKQITVLRQAVENLESIVASGESPTVPMLRGYRDDLLQQMSNLLHKIEQGRRTDTLAAKYG